MEESIKNRVILILAILSAIFFVGTMHSCGTSAKLKNALTQLDKEKSVSWDAEQKMSELKEQKAAADKQIDDAKGQADAAQKALLQEQLITKSLKEELDKITQLKEKLEEDLKEALVENKSKLKK